MHQPTDPNPRDHAPADAAPRGATPGPGGLEEYNRVADTVGLVPNLRLKDNLAQFAAVLVGVVLGAGAGALVSKSRGGAGTDLLIGAAIGAGLGFIVFGILSGLVLMVVGWVRALKGWKKKDRG